MVATKQIEVTLVDIDDDVNTTHTNLMDVMVDRCKRWCERTMRPTDNDTCVLVGYEGKLLSICEKY